MFRNILLLLFICTCVSCKKAEEASTEIEKNPVVPIKLETMMPESIGGQSIRFNGRILNLNSEKVLDHGFYLLKNMYGSTDTTIYKISDAVKSGNNSYLLDELLKEEYAVSLEIQYFVKTQSNLYKANKKNFVPVYIKATPLNDGYVESGQLITIQGDFKNLDESYRIYSGIGNMIDGDLVPFTLNANKSALSFRVPEKLNHGDERNYVLSNNRNLDIFLAKAIVLGKMHPPSINHYFYSDVLRLSSSKVEFNQSKMPFQLIVGKKGFNYSIEINIEDILKEVKGTRFKWGYYNGADTVWFPQDLIIKTPPQNSFLFKQSFAHPYSTIDVYAGELEKYLPIFSGRNTLGGESVFIQTIWTKEDKLTIGNVADGTYPIVFSNGVLDYTSEQKIRIEKLKINSISPVAVYYNDPVVIKGNFIDNKFYEVITNESGLHEHSVIATNGTLTLYPGHTGSDIFEIKKIGYKNERLQNVWIDVNLKVNFGPNPDSSPIIYEGFSPKIGTHETTVKLHGKGLSGGKVYVSGHWIPPFEIAQSTVSITFPRFILPGKYKIAVLYNNKWLTVDDHFELTF